MAKYNFYYELRETLGSTLRKAVRKNKRERRSMSDPVSAALRLAFQDPLMFGTLEGAVLMDEEDYVRLGRRVFVPEDKGLVEVLWRSKMNVDPEDLSGLPRCFSVAWPEDCVIDGVKLRGCLVWFGRQAERMEVVKLLDKWCAFPYNPPTEEEIGAHPEWWAQGFGFHLSYPQGESLKERVYVRLSLPPEWLSRCLSSEEELGSVGTFDLISAELSPDDIHEQYVVAKCVVGLMVYATAFPGAVVPGWPEGVGSSPNTKGRSPAMLASPVQKVRKGGSHASPEAHFRSGRAPYFRSYPRRKDGNKKKGIYLVSGHGPVMVNADASTVKKVKK